MFKLVKRNILTKTNLNIRKVNELHFNFIQMTEKSKGHWTSLENASMTSTVMFDEISSMFILFFSFVVE